MKKWIMLFVVIVCSYKAVYSDDFFRFRSEDYILVENNVEVREKPSSDSNVILKLKIAKMVTIIKHSGIMYKDKKIQGEWVYVDTLQYSNMLNGERQKGWMLDYYLAKGNQFIKVTNFYDIILDGYVGDYQVYYKFKRNGTFSHKYINPMKNNKTEFYNGSVYRYRNVLLVKDGSGVESFYLESNRIFYAESPDLFAELKQ